MVYNTFPWPPFGNAEYPVTSTEKVLSVRETHLAFLTTPPDDYGRATTRRKAAKSFSGTASDNSRKTTVEVAAQAGLDARAKHTTSNLADLYDPLTMPADLVKAHADLDRAVDQCYRKQPFTSDRQRVEFLFALYERLTAPLLPSAPTPRRRTRRTPAFLRTIRTISPIRPLRPHRP